jgi:hypothetical protein
MRVHHRGGRTSSTGISQVNSFPTLAYTVDADVKTIGSLNQQCSLSRSDSQRSLSLSLVPREGIAQKLPKRQEIEGVFVQGESSAGVFVQGGRLCPQTPLLPKKSTAIFGLPKKSGGGGQTYLEKWLRIDTSNQRPMAIAAIVSHNFRLLASHFLFQSSLIPSF